MRLQSATPLDNGFARSVFAENTGNENGFVFGPD